MQERNKSLFPRARALAWIVATIGLFPLSLAAQNVVQSENAKAGTSAWQLSNPATNHEIEGYASLTSVNRGGQISLFVNTADPSYQLDVYRMGWYNGAGAREVMGPVSVTGTSQTIPTPDPTTGIVECQWKNPYTIAVPGDADATNWASGVYLARLTGSSSGKQSFIIFTVRDDSRPATYVFQLSTNTFQAYNNWGGKSLYTWNSTGSIAAINVSYNRPYALGNQGGSSSGVGAGEFLTNVQPSSESAPAAWAYNTLRFLEREGYDVSYITDVDVHESAGMLSTHGAVIIAGHSEYWSWEMRTNVQAALNSGIGVAVFSANTCYWQIRFAASAFTGAADRTIIGYKSTADPYASNPTLSYLTTVLWRNPPVNLPEEKLFGTMYNTDLVNSDLVVADASSWVFTNTGVANGLVLTGLWGYEVDGRHGFAQIGTDSVFHETQLNGNTGDSAVYQASGGGWMFDIGSFQWNWALDDFNVPAVRSSFISPIAQQVTRNVLARLAGQSLPTGVSIVPSPRVQSVNATAGGSVSYTVGITSFGYSPSITLSATGLPSGVSASFSPSTIPGSGTSQLNITVPVGSPTGNYVVTIRAFDGSVTRTEAVSLVLANLSAKSAWQVVYVDSQETTCGNYQGTNSIDGNPATFWHTQFCPAVAPLPHEIQIDLGAAYSINRFGYLPRQDGGTNGRISQYAFYASNNLSNWGTALVTGTFANDAAEKYGSFASGTYRYVRLQDLSEASGGQWTSMAELDLFSAAAGDFSFAASPGSQTVTAGGSTTYTATVGALGGFTGTVTLTAAGLPAGATASFAPSSVTSSGTATLTITTTAAVTAGTYSFTITGTSGSLVHSTTASLIVNGGVTGSPATISIDFVGNSTVMSSSESAGVVSTTMWNSAAGAKSSSPLSLVNAAGSTTGALISWVSDNTWSLPITDSPGSVRMMAGYLDTGSSNPTTATVTGLASGTYNIYVYADGDNGGSSRSATYQISGTGVTTTSVSLTDAANTNFSGTFSQANNSSGNYVLFSNVSITSGFTLTATPGATPDAPRAPLNGIQIIPVGTTPDFGLSVAPASQTVAAGSSTTYTVTTTATGGFSGTVNLAASGLPSGANAAFNPASITGAGSSTLTITTGSSTPVASTVFTVTGTSSALTHSGSATLVVTSGGGGTGNPSTISVDFVGTGTAMGSSESAGVVSTTMWNNAAGAKSSSPLSLVNAAGSTTGASISWVSDNTWSLPITDSAGNVRMMRGYLDNGAGSSTTVTVAGLASGTYNIYVYADGDNAGSSHTGAYQISGSGVTTSSISLTDAPNVNFSGTFVQANNSNGNYVLFNAVSISSGFTLTATPGATPDVPRAPLNGIQIIPVGTTPNFGLSVAPASQTVAAGSSTTYTVTTTATGGFSGTVNLAASGLPSGANAAFNPASITGAGSSTLTITTGSSTPVASTVFTVTGTSSALTHSGSATLVVTSGGGGTGNPSTISVDFVGTGTAMGSSESAGVVSTTMWNNAAGAKSSSPLSLVNAAGSTTGASISWVSDNTWSLPITDSAGNVRMMRGYLDNGAGSSTTVTVAGLASGTYNIYVYADGDNAGSSHTGAYQISGSGVTTSSISLTDAPNVNFSGTFVQANNSNGNYVLFNAVSISSGFTLTATPGATPDVPRAPLNGIQIIPVGTTPNFGLSVAPASQTVAAGSSTTYTVTTTATGGFSGTVNLAASGLPSGANAAFNPASITGAGSSTLTITTGSSTPVASTVFTVTGTSSALTHSGSATLVVTSGGGGTGNPSTISVDFVGTGTAMGSSESAGVVSTTMWNNAAGAKSSSPLSLVNAAGSTTGASISWVSDNTWSLPITDSAGNVRMMRGYLDNGAGSSTTVTVAGLASGTYNIYVYADGDNAGSSHTGAYQISGSGVTTSSISLTDAPNVNFSGTFVQANNSNGNYVLFNAVPISSGFTLTATPGATGNVPRAPMNGIQIIPAP